MYSIALCVGLGLIVALALTFGFDVSGWASSLIGMAVFAGSFYFVSRFVSNKIMVILEQAGRDMQAQRFEKAIREMKDALKFGPWQLYVADQINSQIGMAHYVRREFSAAFPYLEKAFFRNWAAMAMLAISYMKRHKREKMTATFDKAVQWNGKESLLWNLYAFCLVEEYADKTRALEILDKGLKKLPEDPILLENKELLLAGKKIKMRSFGDQWYQFHLESLGQLQKHQMASLGGRAQKRTMVRR